MDDPGWRVNEDDSGVRLDKFLADPARLGSRGRALDVLRRGKVFLNDVEAPPEAAAHRLAPGDTVRLWMDRPGTARRRPVSPHAARDLQIVYEDDVLIVVDKPAGLLAVPLPRRADAPSLIDALVKHLRTRGRVLPLVVHRIDRDTSGLVAFAKRADAHSRLKQQFLRHEPERVYLAVVYGHPSPSSGSWRDQLVWDDEELIQKATHRRDPRGREARSDYRVVESFRDTSLVEIRLVTGRRNQIRLQARLRGHTLVGERRYVYGPDALRAIEFPRQALHAFRLGLRHPLHGQPLRFEAPLPRDMVGLLAQLRRGFTSSATV